MVKSRTTGVKRAHTSAPAPVPQKTAPAPAQPQSGFLGNLVGGAVTGLGLGAGSEIAHRAIGGLLDGEKKAECDKTRLNACLKEGGECLEEMREFMRCLDGNK